MTKSAAAVPVDPAPIVGDVRLRSGQIVRGFSLRPGVLNRTLADVLPGAVWLPKAPAGAQKPAAPTKAATPPRATQRPVKPASATPRRVVTPHAPAKPDRAAIAKSWDEAHTRVTPGYARAAAPKKGGSQ